MTVLEALQKIPYLRVIYADDHKIFCSVRITISRMEEIDSGSMRFSLPRHYTFGQLVVFTDLPTEDDQCGALFYNTTTGEDAVTIIENIREQLEASKEIPENTYNLEE